MNQKTIKEGVVTSSNKKLKGGFNLNQFVLKFLKWIGFADTVDCCTYYPTVPTVLVADITSPTEEEMINIPVKGLFFAAQEEDFWALRVKYSATGSIQIVINA